MSGGLCCAQLLSYTAIDIYIPRLVESPLHIDHQQQAHLEKQDSFLRPQDSFPRPIEIREAD
jgi:hypothetical protein